MVIFAQKNRKMAITKDGHHDIGLLKNGMVSKTQFAVNYVQRLVIQLLLPNSVRGWVFRTFARE